MVSLSLGYFIKDNDNHLLTSLYVKLPSICWWSTSSWIWIYWTLIWDSYSRQEVLQTFGLAGFWFPPLGGEGGDSQLLSEVTAEEEIILPPTPIPTSDPQDPERQVQHFIILIYEWGNNCLGNFPRFQTPWAEGLALEALERLLQDQTSVSSKSKLKWLHQPQYNPWVGKI